MVAILTTKTQTYFSFSRFGFVLFVSFFLGRLLVLRRVLFLYSKDSNFFVRSCIPEKKQQILIIYHRDNSHHFSRKDSGNILYGGFRKGFQGH